MQLLQNMLLLLLLLLLLLKTNLEKQVLRAQRFNGGVRPLCGWALLHQWFYHRKPLKPRVRRYMPRWALLRGGFRIARAMPNWDILRSRGISKQNTADGAKSAGGKASLHFFRSVG